MTINRGDYVLLLAEKNEYKDQRQKLGSISVAPYLVNESDEKSKTFVIEYADKTVENVPKSRVVRESKRQTAAELQDVVQQTITDATFVEYPLTDATKNSLARPE